MAALLLIQQDVFSGAGDDGKVVVTDHPRHSIGIAAGTVEDVPGLYSFAGC